MALSSTPGVSRRAVYEFPVAAERTWRRCGVTAEKAILVLSILLSHGIGGLYIALAAVGHIREFSKSTIKLRDYTARQSLRVS